MIEVLARSPRAAAAILCVLILPREAGADAPVDARESTWRPSVEIDPQTAVYWLLGSLAYSVHALVKPPGRHWRFGIDNYAGDTPSSFLASDLQAWHVRYAAYGVQAQYFITDWFGWDGWPKGLFIGTFVVAHRWQYRIGNGQTDTFRAGVTPELGLQYMPIPRCGFYVTPWVGATFDVRLAGSPDVGAQHYPESAVSPIVTLHVGYEF